MKKFSTVFQHWFLVFNIIGIFAGIFCTIMINPLCILLTIMSALAAISSLSVNYSKKHHEYKGIFSTKLNRDRFIGLGKDLRGASCYDRNDFKRSEERERGA